MKITLSAIKADIGGVGGHTKPSTELVDAVKNFVLRHKDLFIDSYIGYTGDDIHILMSHTKGVNNPEIHKLAFDAFMEGTKLAKEQGLYGAGQDMLKTAFSGNIRGLGPGSAEIEFEERPNEAVMLFAADKTEPGAFNMPFYYAFAEVSRSPGLMLSTDMRKGAVFTTMDVANTEADKIIQFFSLKIYNSIFPLV